MVCLLQNFIVRYRFLINALYHGGDTPFYKPYRYRYVPPQGYGFCRFGLKTGIDFAHFGLDSGMVFEESTTGVYEHIFRFNSK